MTRQEELVEALNRHQRLAMSIGQRWAAHMALHTAACINGSVEEMKQRREDLHIVLDTLLDNGESIQRLSDELNALINR